jgi:large subunit ribosomal protein L15
MAILSQLKPKAGSKKSMKRLGRGDGSGHGGTSTRGHKGQKARSSVHIARGFEGGQMPLQRRSPKWGFTALNKVVFCPFNLDTLSQFFKAGETVTPESLYERGLIQRKSDQVKILGRGKLAHALTIHVHAASASAKSAIESAKGTLTLIQRNKKTAEK